MSRPIEARGTSPMRARPMRAGAPRSACSSMFFHYICCNYYVVSYASNTVVFLFFQSVYSHRYSSPEILKVLAKPHSRKWCAGVSLNCHQRVWHFWLLKGSVCFLFLVFMGQCSAVAGWQAVGQRSFSRTRRCASFLWTTRWRGLRPFFWACFPFYCLLPSPVLLPTSCRQLWLGTRVIRVPSSHTHAALQPAVS